MLRPCNCLNLKRKWLNISLEPCEVDRVDDILKVTYTEQLSEVIIHTIVTQLLVM